MDIDHGIDFTREEVAEAMLAYAKRKGATGPATAEGLLVFTLGSRLRKDGCFLRIQAAT